MFKPTHIVVVESGWVLAVDCPDAKVEQNIEARHARVIRQWGTTNGLAELAISGPTKNTVLDLCSVIDIPASKILMLLHVNPAQAWGS
jgi:hypothetical protein